MEGDAILPDKNRLTLAYVLSALLAVLLVISSVTGLLYGGYDLYDSYLATRLFIRASIQTFFSGVGALDFKATAWLVLQSKNITELALESGYLASCGRTPPNTTCVRLSSDVHDNPQSFFP